MTSNIYYNPEHYGLTVVAEIEYSDGCYQFDTRVVWKTQEDKLVTARDSGCSCPTPFEDHNLTTVESVDYDALRNEVMGEVNSEWRRNITMEQGQEFLRKIRGYKILSDGG